MNQKDAFLYAKLSHIAYGEGFDYQDFKLRGRFKNQATDTQGIFGEVSGSSFLLAFRGSEETGTADWINDLKFMPTEYPYVEGKADMMVHYGFMEAYKSVREAIIKAVKDSPMKKVVLVGHSLGGALAVLCALDMGCNLPQKSVQCVTFGCPKVGDPAFVKTYNEQVPTTYRFVNGPDIVPSIPPDIPFLIDYEHVGKLCHIGEVDASQFSLDAAMAHLPQNYAKVLESMNELVV